MPMQSSFSFPDLLLPSFGGFGPVNLGMKMAPEPQPSNNSMPVAYIEDIERFRIMHL